MPDIIQLLPDNVANQIAAGEVVQRPASAIKEMVENAIDAGATQVKVIVKDSGKTLIQVIDNGKGMSATDARMCFERHATSKIKKSEDLFHIVTKGFRGEALASIAAVAQVEMRTRQTGEPLGTRIEIEGSKFKLSEPDQCPEGTNLSVKNLFFNVPARRYFLKSDAIELRHIIDEIHRVALTHPDVEFSFHHNGSEVFSLPKASIRQRIVHVLGNKYNEKLVPVEEETDIVSVNGFVGKPEAAKKTRGEQFFFVNQRFIKSSYLNHAVNTAFDQLLPDGNFPLYILFLDIDPAQIDINIHPTKTEIKFQDERAIYAILHAAVKRALGRHNIAPTLDFNQEMSINVQPMRSDAEIQIPTIKVNPDYNPFDTKPKRESLAQGWFDHSNQRTTGWEELMAISKMVNPDVEETSDEVQRLFELDEDVTLVQMHRRFIVCQTEGGILVVDQERAHRRVLFERFSSQFDRAQFAVQQLLFPEDIVLSAADFALVNELLEDIRSLGFEMEVSGPQQFQITGVPADAEVHDPEKLMETFVEQLKNEQSELTYTPREKLAWALARSTSIRGGQMLTVPEMKDLIQRLSTCKQPNFAESRKATFVKITLEQLLQQFR
jgi:DNA mismatch repair protein MutL